MIEPLIGLDDQDDRRSVHSVASTVATTTSLASRLAALNVDFGDKLREAEEDNKEPVCETLAEDSAGEQEDPEQPSASEAAASLNGSASASMREREPPLFVCSRLFERRGQPPLRLQRLSMMQVEDFRQHGYVVLDGLIPRDAAARIKAEVLRQHARGRMQSTTQQQLGILSPRSYQLAPATAHTVASPPTNGHAAAAAAPSSLSRRSTGGGAANGAAANGVHSNPCNGSSNGHAASTPGKGVSVNGAAAGAGAAGVGSSGSVGEKRLVLTLGQPPSDTAVLAPLMAALQEVQDDLHEFMRLRHRSALEYSLALMPPAAAPIPRHRDAPPDDGRGDTWEAAAAAAAPLAGAAGGGLSNGSSSQCHHDSRLTASELLLSKAASVAAGGCREVPGSPHSEGPVSSPTSSTRSGPTHSSSRGGYFQSSSNSAAGGSQQPRVTCLVFLNPDWDKEGGGVLRLWPPVNPLRNMAAASTAGGGGGGRRSPSSSDAGTTFSDYSDCSSLRLHMLGSTTSSVYAEPSYAAEHDAASLDGLSVADSEVERYGFEWVETEGGEMALDCAPLAGRCVLLLSGAVEYALLPGQAAAADMVYARTTCR